MTESVTRAEVCVAAVSDFFRGDGDSFASPMGLIPSIGARLAAHTHSPDLLLSDGEGHLYGPVPAFGEKPEFYEGWMPFSRVFDVLHWGKRHVMMGATQIDRWGNQNISAIGPFEKPKRQLLGSRGAPANTVSHTTSYWVPRHSTRVFLENVDVISGVGPSAAAAAGIAASQFNDIRGVVSNLGVFDFAGPESTLRLISLHPGVTVEAVREATACELAVADDLAESRIPDAEELRLIRDIIDPKGAREREVPNP